MARVAFIQLCRSGDIVSILPAAKAVADGGDEVTFITMPDFVGILEAVSYVTVHCHDTHVRDVNGAADKAKQMGFDRIIRCQVDGNAKNPPVNTDNFIAQQWSRAGFLDRFHDLPLIFDRRDSVGEAKSLAAHLPKEDGRPLLLTCFMGKSSPYPHIRDQRKWVDDTFARDWRILHLGDICLPKIHYLLAFLEKADCLLTIDTLPLHLAYATMTPTIAMSVPERRYQSEARAHWVYHCDYPTSISVAARNEIKRILDRRDFAPGRLCRTMPTMLTDRIVHVVDWFLGNERDNPRILNARKSWDRVRESDPNYQTVFHKLDDTQRSSRDIGDTRRLPYIKDIIDFGARHAQPNDILVFTNSDVSLCEEATQQIREKLREQPCCYSRRVDTGVTSQMFPLDYLRQHKAHVGADLFAFRAEWWWAHRGEMPDVFLSCEGWDALGRFWLRKHVASPEMQPPVIWHQQHQSWWALPDVIHQNAAQRWNREKCVEWVKANGCERALYNARESQYLFRRDEEWMNREPCPT